MNVRTLNKATRWGSLLAIGALLGLPVYADAQRQQDQQPQQPPAVERDRDQQQQRGGQQMRQDEPVGIERRDGGETIDPRQWRREFEARVQQRRELVGVRQPYAAERRQQTEEGVYARERQEVDAREWRREFEGRVQQRLQPEHRARQPYAMERRQQVGDGVYGRERQEVDPREWRREWEAHIQQRHERQRAYRSPYGIDRDRRGQMQQQQQPMQQRRDPQYEQQGQQGQQRDSEVHQLEEQAVNPDRGAGPAPNANNPQTGARGEAFTPGYQEPQPQPQPRTQRRYQRPQQPGYFPYAEDPRGRDTRFPEDRHGAAGIYGTDAQRRAAPLGADPNDPFGDRARRWRMEPYARELRGSADFPDAREAADPYVPNGVHYPQPPRPTGRYSPWPGSYREAERLRERPPSPEPRGYRGAMHGTYREAERISR